MEELKNIGKLFDKFSSQADEFISNRKQLVEFIIKYGEGYLLELPVIEGQLFNVVYEEEQASTFPTPFNGARFVRECKINFDDIIIRKVTYSCDLTKRTVEDKYIVLDNELTLIEGYAKCDVCGNWTKEDDLHEARYDQEQVVYPSCREDGN